MPLIPIFLSQPAIDEFRDELHELATYGTVHLDPRKPRPETIECILIALREYQRGRHV